jgi:hypothetical protein
MTRRIVKLSAMLICLAGLTGCDWAVTGQVDREKLFLPLSPLGRGYLSLDLSRQGGPGKIEIKYLDFSGQRVALEIIELPPAKPRWSWELGRGAKKYGRSFYALKVERMGDKSQPLPFVFHPLVSLGATPLGRPMGLHEPRS